MTMKIKFQGISAPTPEVRTIYRKMV